MIRITQLSTLFLGAALMAGCATGLGGGGDDSTPALKVTNEKAFQGKNDIIIGSFRVSFITFDKESASASDDRFLGADRGYARSTLRARLVGIEDDVFQALTDQAYADFRHQLESAGYRIADPTPLTSHKDYRRVSFEDSPVRNESTLKALTGGSREDITFAPSGMRLMKYALNSNMMPYHVQSIAADIGTPVINAHYIIHFAGFSADADTTRNYNMNRNEYNAEVSMGQNIQALSGSTVQIYNGLPSTFARPNGDVTLQRSLATGAAFGESVNATSGAQKFANAFSGMVGMFSGGSSSAEEFNVQADPARYRAGARQALQETNERIAAQMSALR